MLKPRTCIHWQAAQNGNNNQNNSSNRKSHNISKRLLCMLHSRCALKFIRRHFHVCLWWSIRLFFLFVLFVCANIIRFNVSNMSHIVHGSLSTRRFVHVHIALCPACTSLSVCMQTLAVNYFRFWSKGHTIFANDKTRDTDFFGWRARCQHSVYWTFHVSDEHKTYTNYYLLPIKSLCLSFVAKHISNRKKNSRKCFVLVERLVVVFKL